MHNKPSYFIDAHNIIASLYFHYETTCKDIELPVSKTSAHTQAFLPYILTCYNQFVEWIMEVRSMICFSLPIFLQNTPVKWLEIITKLALVKHTKIQLDWQVFSFIFQYSFFIPCNVCQLAVLHFLILTYLISFGFHDPYFCCFFSYPFNIFFFSTHFS